MIIHPPQCVREKDSIRLSSFIEIEKKPHLSKELWFTFPKEYEEHISLRSEGFAVALLLLAMYVGEDIKVKGNFSPRLLYGLKEYQKYFCFWYKNTVSEVAIVSDALVESNRQENFVLSAFSGGIDSYYTLLSHLGDTVNPFDRITHCLYVHGFDIEINDTCGYDQMMRRFAPFFKEIGVQLIPVSTNIRNDFYGGELTWGDFAHGASLLSMPILFDGYFSRFYIPATHTYADSYPWGSNPLIDHYISTESLETFHDGIEVTRTEKTRKISERQETYERVRVCIKQPERDLMNCCRCRKCVRTMITLKLMGVLSEYKRSFPLPLGRNVVRSAEVRNKNDLSFIKELLELAKEKSDNKAVLDLLYSMKKAQLIIKARQVKRSIDARFNS
ncbi:hypothetical protein KKH43_02565 [Patescibacteria group bacterium]|nr:hypothetical protein [Patescibacteria group bacterium]